MQNPFFSGRPAPAPALLAQKPLLDRLFTAVKGGVNQLVFTPDGHGKTSLLKALETRVLSSEAEVILVKADLFPCRCPEDFFRVLRMAVLASSGDRKEKMSSLYADSDPAVLDMPQYLCMDRMVSGTVLLDNFQAVLDFPGAEAFLRSFREHAERHSRVCYCLAAGRPEQIRPLFERTGAPMHAFAQLHEIEDPAQKDWIRFISQAFASTGKTAAVADIVSLLEMAEFQPAAVQALAEALWFRTEKTSSPGLLREAFDAVLGYLTPAFTRIYNQLSPKQISFLYAIIDRVPSFYSADTQRRYDLGTPGNIRRMKEALEKKEILDSSGRGLPLFQDPLFKAWLVTLRGCAR